MTKINGNNAQQILTREEYRNQQSKDALKKRSFPIWLRVLLVFTLAFVALIVGMVLGYGVLGKGDMADALRWDTWQHIIDLVKKP